MKKVKCEVCGGDRFLGLACPRCGYIVPSEAAKAEMRKQARRRRATRLVEVQR